MNTTNITAIEFINQHPEIIYWNIFRWYEDDDVTEWKEIDVLDIVDGELIDDFFFDGEGGCDLFLLEGSIPLEQ